MTKRELPLLTVYIASESYMKSMKKEVGWAFKNYFFVIRDGIEQGYRFEDDFVKLKKFLNQIKNKSAFLKQIYKKLKIYSEQYKKLLETTEKQILKNKNNRDLLNLFKDIYQTEKKLYAVLHIPLYFESAINNLRGRIIRNDLKRLAILRGEAAGLIFKMYGDCFGFFEEFSRRFNIKRSLVTWMLPIEIKKSLKRGRPVISESILKKRFQLSILITKNTRTRLLIGDKAQRFIRKYFELFKDVGDIKEIRGKIAYRGRVFGIARIVIGKSDFPKIKNKDIVIAPTTSVHYVPYLKKVAAIVTDEGGITSHAAIISREMKKPCIIGTKIATKVLKDGQLVEVDANKGVVKILNSK